jgi:hypothetical protein
MFGKLLKKVLGKRLGTVADTIVDGAADKATGGLSTIAEETVKKVKTRKKK